MTEQTGRQEYKFFVDAKEYGWQTSSINGVQIKQKASVPDDYQLYLEEEGDTPDRPISDGEVVDLSGRVKHFFAVPPATFGY